MSDTTLYKRVRTGWPTRGGNTYKAEEITEAEFAAIARARGWVKVKDIDAEKLRRLRVDVLLGIECVGGVFNEDTMYLDGVSPTALQQLENAAEELADFARAVLAALGKETTP